MRLARIGCLSLVVVSCAAKPKPPVNTVDPATPVAVEPGMVPPPPDLRQPPSDAVHLNSGLVIRFLSHGTGTIHPTAKATVKVDYTGWTQDGRMFDTSQGRGATDLPLDGVIEGWTQGIQLMSVGDSARLWIPAALAYRGAQGAPGGLLVFDVTLISFVEPVPPPPTPWDVAAPPPSATHLPSGLALRVLTEGTGAVHPVATDRVKVSYSMWTSDGRLVDSSVVRGAPDVFPLNAVVPGFSEGVTQMVTGEKVRLWVPPTLGYGNGSGNLVFDVELLEINP